MASLNAAVAVYILHVVLVLAVDRPRIIESVSSVLRVQPGYYIKCVDQEGVVRRIEIDASGFYQEDGGIPANAELHSGWVSNNHRGRIQFYPAAPDQGSVRVYLDAPKPRLKRTRGRPSFHRHRKSVRIKLFGVKMP